MSARAETGFVLDTDESLCYNRVEVTKMEEAQVSQAIPASQARVGKAVLYITTAYMVFLTIYTLGIRISLFATAFDLIFSETGFMDWYRISIIGCGLLALLAIILSGKSLLREDIILLALLFVWMGVSSFVNREFGLVENLYGFVTISVTVVAFYLIGRRFHKLDILFILKRVILWGSVVWNVGCAISLYMYFANEWGYFKFNGFIRISRQGIMEGRLFGCFSDPNYAALISVLLIVGLVFLFKFGFKDGCRRAYVRFMRIYMAVSILLCLLYAVLSGSRSTDVSVIVATVIVCLLLAYRQRLPIGAYIARILLALILLAGVYFGLLYGMQGIGMVFSPERNVEEEFDRDDVSVENISNSRFDIWSDYLSLVRDRPLFGFSSRGALPYARKLDPDSYLSKKGYNPHSMYIQLLVQLGVIGLIIVIRFLLRAFLRLIMRIRRRKTLSRISYIMLIWLMVHGVFCIFNVGIFISPCFEAMIAWISFGYWEQICERARDEGDVPARGEAQEEEKLES